MRLLRTLKSHVLKFIEKPLPQMTPDEAKRVDKLRQRFVGLDSSDAPSGPEWQANTRRLTELVAQQDPREFLRWDVIRRTMFVGNPPYVRDELAYLKRQADWTDRWESAVREDSIGRPSPSDCHPGSSGNLIHYAYHLARFEACGQLPVDQLKFSFEFGGGYGGMCRLFRNLGFQGTYVIFDLPHFSALQQYYLTSIGVNVLSVDDVSPDSSGVCCISNLNDARKIMSQLDGASSSTERLFLATWSFSESPVELRSSFNELLPKFGSISLAYQNQFSGVDNCDWFQQFQATLGHLSWQGGHIDHLPDNYYLTGSSQSAERSAA